MIEPVVLSATPSVFTQYLAEVRDASVQADRLRFRTNLQRAGHALALEISRHLTYKSRSVTTPLGQTEQRVLAQQPVLAAILRAALPMHQGFLDVFDRADNAFVSAYRAHDAQNENEFTVKVEYLSAPSLVGRTVILIDPMIATGMSMAMSYEALRILGEPEQVFVVGLIASEQGLNYVQRHIPQARIFVGAVDLELTAKSYIVPGLGDAGDLAYGEKAPLA
jgi:uracil phosphoribosyltransferase